jgi:hypothetical protein
LGNDDEDTTSAKAAAYRVAEVLDMITHALTKK